VHNFLPQTHLKKDVKHCVVLCVVKMREVLISISDRILVSVFFILYIFIPSSYLLHSCINFLLGGGPNCILCIPSNQFSFVYFNHIYIETYSVGNPLLFTKHSEKKLFSTDSLWHVTEQQVHRTMQLCCCPSSDSYH